MLSPQSRLILGLLGVAGATACGAETSCLDCVESPWAEPSPAVLRLVAGGTAPGPLRNHPQASDGPTPARRGWGELSV